MLSLVKSVNSYAIIVVICLGILAGLVGGCADLDRSNPLDPKNPSSERTKVVLIEAFVSQGTGLPYNDHALQALDELLRTYSSNVILLEYHVQAVGGNDPLATETNSARYRVYEPNSSDRASPDVFFSGSLTGIQGASSSTTAYSRYEDVLTSILNTVTHFSIEATVQLSGTVLSFEVDVARLGSSKADNVTLYLAIIEDRGSAGQHRVVREFLPLETLGTLEAGEIKSTDRNVTLSSELAASNFRIVVFAQNTGSGGVYQATYAE